MAVVEQGAGGRGKGPCPKTHDRILKDCISYMHVNVVYALFALFH